MNKLLNVVNVAHSVLGAAPLRAISTALNRWSGHVVPEWTPYMPKGAAPLNLNPPKPEAAERGVPRKVVYVPACVTRIMGPSKGDYETGGWGGVCGWRDGEPFACCPLPAACHATQEATAGGHPHSLPPPTSHTRPAPCSRGAREAAQPVP